MLCSGEAHNTFVAPITPLLSPTPRLSLSSTHTSPYLTKLYLRNSLAALFHSLTLHPQPISLFGLLLFHIDAEIRWAGHGSTFNLLSIVMFVLGTLYFILAVFKGMRCEESKVSIHLIMMSQIYIFHPSNHP